MKNFQNEDFFVEKVLYHILAVYFLVSVLVFSVEDKDYAYTTTNLLDNKSIVVTLLIVALTQRKYQNKARSSWPTAVLRHS